MSTDAKADGNFQPVHRAGYQTDRLERCEIKTMPRYMSHHPFAAPSRPETR
jgi:hypothetical protein